MIKTDNFRLYLIDHLETPKDAASWEEGLNWSDYALWETGDTKRNVTVGDEEPIIDIDRTGEVDALALVLVNESDFDYVGRPYRVALQASYTIENTDDL